MQIPSIYIHIPFCSKKCRYCNFYSKPPENDHQIDSLLNAELKELPEKLDGFQGGETPSIYIGGGTPSLIRDKLPNFIKNLQSTLNECEVEYANTEFTVEVNPGDVSREFLSHIRALGVNRISIGAQSFDDKELKMLGRRHDSEDIFTAVEAARTCDFDNISLDLIFALPFQTLNQWKENLKKAIELVPHHISTYSLTWEEGTEMTIARNTGKLTSATDELDRDMYYTTIDLLSKEGMDQYEISNFSIPGYQCRHNLRYWDDYNYIGIGPSAGSHIDNTRWTNIGDIKEYISRVNDSDDTYDDIENLNNAIQARQAAVLGLRKTQGICITEFKERFDVDLEKIYGPEIEKHTSEGILEIVKDHIRLTRKGLSFCDMVAEDFV